jgi:hypothetical protein
VKEGDGEIAISREADGLRSSAQRKAAHEARLVLEKSKRY